MLNTDKDIWGLLCAGSDGLEDMQIMHLPTIVENAKGDKIIRGYYGISLHWKKEVDINLDNLLDIVTTAPLLEVADEESLLPPPDISRNKTAITKLKEVAWVPTRCPVVIPLVGNVCSGQIKADGDSALNMVKAYHPLAWYWLNAVHGYKANGKQDVDVLVDCKNYIEVIRDKEEFLFQSPRIFFHQTPCEESNALCMKEARARRREMRATNQRQYYAMNAGHLCLPDPEDDHTINEDSLENPSADQMQNNNVAHATAPIINPAPTLNTSEKPASQPLTQHAHRTPPVSGLAVHNLQQLAPSPPHNVQPITKTTKNPPVSHITFQQQAVQTQQQMQHVMPTNAQQPPEELPQHHNPNPPTLSGINPFIMPGLKLPIELPQLTTTRVFPLNNVTQ